MISTWNKYSIEKILLQLDDMKLPFEDYSFERMDDGNLQILGRGGFSLVYAAKRRRSRRTGRYVIKVMGFNDRHIDDDAFAESVYAQSNISEEDRHIVRIYDGVSIHINIDEEGNIRGISDEMGNDGNDESCLIDFTLQFVVMERLIPVISRNISGKISLYPERLAQYEYKEILKCAHDIGIALETAHKSGIIHRDVKLENIFYSNSQKVYKLGDFGMSKIIDEGTAETIVYTKGYGAPEVVDNEYEEYDSKADIYSFGIMIYLLLNRLRFPGSQDYNVNFDEQYRARYMLPLPASKMTDLYCIVTKMCHYYQHARYDSMTDVVNDIESIIYGTNISYKRNHRSLYLVFGTYMIVTGAIIWKLSVAPDFTVHYSKFLYIFMALTLMAVIFHLIKIKEIYIQSVMLITGIAWCIVDGFSIWKILFTILICTSWENAMVASLVLITIKIIDGVGLKNYVDADMSGVRWLVLLLVPMAVYMIFQYNAAGERNRFTTLLYLKFNMSWICTTIIYAAVIYIGMILPSYDFIKAGIIGIVFSVTLIIRETIISNNR